MTHNDDCNAESNRQLNDYNLTDCNHDYNHDHTEDSHNHYHNNYHSKLQQFSDKVVLQCKEAVVGADVHNDAVLAACHP